MDVDSEILPRTPQPVPTKPLDENPVEPSTSALARRTLDPSKGYDSKYAEQARSALLADYPYLSEVHFGELVESSMHIDPSLFDQVCTTLLESQVVRDPDASSPRAWLNDDAIELESPAESATGENALFGRAIPSIIRSILEACTNAAQVPTSVIPFAKGDEMPDGDMLGNQRPGGGLQVKPAMWSPSEQSEPAFGKRENYMQIVLPMESKNKDTEGNRLDVCLRTTRRFDYIDVLPGPRQSGVCAPSSNAK